MENESEFDLQTDGAASLPYTPFQDIRRDSLISDSVSKNESESVISNPPCTGEFVEIQHDSGKTLSTEGSSSDASELESPLSDLDLNESNENQRVDQDNVVPGPEADISLEDLQYIDKDGDTLLHTAIILGLISIAKVLVDIVYKLINSQNKLFQTPLHLAVLCDESNMVKYLLNHYADLHLQDQHGRTAFHMACERNGMAMLSTLIHDGCHLQTNRIKTGIHPLDIKDYNGETCLHVCTKQANCAMVQALLDKGADVNLRDTKRGKGPLHIAAEIGNVDLVKCLLQNHDVKPDIITYDQERPVELACIRGHKEVEELLTKCSMKLNKKHLAKYAVPEKEFI